MYEIRKIHSNEVMEALALALEVFLQFEAPDYKPEGIETFKRDIVENDEFISKCQQGICPIEFKDLYPHAIRHTFCSRCFEKGMDAKVVQMLMGHQHYSTTIDIYTHVTETKFEEEIAKFGSVSEKQKVQKNKNSTQCA